MSPFILSDADLARRARPVRVQRATTTVADALDSLFGDSFSRALYRETKWSVPDDQRTTCPVHQDWRSHCLPLHIDRPARQAVA